MKTYTTDRVVLGFLVIVWSTRIDCVTAVKIDILFTIIGKMKNDDV